jgi:hypothetical protein
LEVDKAAGEAKAHQMARTAFGTIIVLVVLAGIGAFAFVPRQRNGHASKAPSVIPETEEVLLSKPTNFTEIALATAVDPKQFDAAYSIALETNEPPLANAADITTIEAAPADVRPPLASYSEPETEKPSPPEDAIRAELRSGGEALEPKLAVALAGLYSPTR